MKRFTFLMLSLFVLGTLLCGLPGYAAVKLQLLLPLGRVAYQTNEHIDLSVVRSDTQALAPGSLVLTLTGEDASTLAFTFPVQAAPLAGADARATEHLHVNGWLLRPGNYTVTVDADGATAQTHIEVYSHERRTTFKLVNWGRVQGKEQLADGQDNFGFNLYYAAYGGNDQDANIRAGMDYMPCCTMSGGHQMDLRLECDWSDPNVLSGGRARVARRALTERINPNCLGIHFYDEPGMTWWTDPKSGKSTNANIPAQVRSFKAAFGYDVPYFGDLDAKNAEQVAKWREFVRWKATVMESAWQDAKFGVNYVKPDFMTATQSQYGWSAFSDGYYFNIVRPLSVVSGHGGYHDWGPGYWHPSFTMEVARAHDFNQPCWYLPGWYGNTTSDQFRLEQYLSFQTNIQGMISPPDLEPARNPGARDGITESNKLMGRFGTVFTTMPVTRGSVGILYSLSHLVDANTKDPQKYFYAHCDPHGEYIHLPYIATKLLQQNSQFVLDEDVLDGTLAANYRAVILSAVNVLDPAVIAGLERFAAHGGLVLLSSDCQVQIQGAIKLEVKADYPAENYARAAEMKTKLEAMKKDPANDKKTLDAFQAQISAQTYGLRASLQGAQLWAKALKPYFDKAGITPVFTCSEPGISGTRQAQGDVEYLFAVNATHDFASPDAQLALKAVKATISLPNDGRPVYDAIRGGAVTEFPDRAGSSKKPAPLTGDFSFAPGDIRIFARTARPIARVLVLKPAVRVDTTQDKAPVQVDLRAMVMDANADVLTGSFPLRVRVLDPQGAARYDLYRATTDGMLALSLPLAANDPAGAWTVEVTELLNNTVGNAPFTFQPLTACGAMAGATQRAVLFGDDRENMKRFFRVHKQLTLATGTSEYALAAAQRFADSAKPWGVKCDIVPAATLNKPEPDPNDQWLIDQYKHMNKPTTWCGPGGYDVPGPVVAFGNADDNPLIKGITAQKVLAYQPVKDVFPGRGRGMLAWQLDSIRQGQESITVIAYDAEGMSEAAGTLYQMVADQDPITPLALPQAADIVPATKCVMLPEATVLWHVTLPDRATSMTAADGKVVVITYNGQQHILSETGKLLAQQPAKSGAPAAPAATVPDGIKSAVLPGKLVKAVANDAGLTAIAYWGGTVQIVDAQGAVKTQQLLPQDISALAWLNGKLIVGQADGQVLALTTVGK